MTRARFFERIKERRGSLAANPYTLDRRAALKLTAGVYALASGARLTAAKQARRGVAEAEADRRASAIVAQMTMDEQIQLVNGGVGFANPLVHVPKPEGALNTSGFVGGIPRLRIPSLHETDGGQGVANRGEKRRGDEATQLPSGLALAATFDPDLVRQAGAVLGAEARAKGFNVVLGGIAQIVREPRGGRNFESAGEDPLLSGRIVGAMVKGTQSQGVVSTVKHFAVNVQETGRSVHNAVIGESALRESDLLAFHIAIDEGRPGSIMAAYNKINGEWSTESSLLNRVVKGEWGFKGWIMSDWGSTHSAAKAALAGLDQQSGREFDEQPWFDGPLKQEVLRGAVPPARLADMNRRILRSLIVTGVFDAPPKPGGPIDWERNAAVAERAAEAGIVLLKNDGPVLPLPNSGRIAVIGGHADKGVPTGGGSAQVIPKGGVAYRDLRGSDMVSRAIELIYARSVPLRELRAELPEANIRFDDGSDPARAAAVAAAADVAIVFVVKPSAEALDNPGLDLPDGQEALVSNVAAANRRTIVVIQTGNVVLMPWLDRVAAVIAAWFPGQRGAEALAAILAGRISPSGRTPVSFPRSLQDLPRPQLPGWRPDVGVDLAVGERPDPFDIVYHEGSDVGYRWYERQQRKPLFAFGRGLTYSRFAYRDLVVMAEADGRLLARFTLENIGSRAATEVPQLYVAPPGRTHRFAGWQRVTLAAGEKRRVSLVADQRVLRSHVAGRWKIADGTHHVVVGAEAGTALLQASIPGTRLR
jgi:beta-glucosidase